MNSDVHSRLTTSIPKDKLPDCWNDDERMKSLYSAIRPSFVNPNDRSGKFQFWKKMIAIWCQHNRTCYFSMIEIKNAFLRDSQIPTCLEDLTNEMKGNAELVTVEKLLQSPSKTWSNWAYSVFVSKPISWSYDRFWSYLSKNEMKSTNLNEEYVYMPVLREQCRDIFAKIPQDYRLQLVSLDDLLENCEFLKGTDSKTLLLNVMELQKQQLVDVMETVDDDQHHRTHLLVKFGKLNQRCPAISAVDKSRFKLEQSRIFLIKEISKIEDKSDKILEEVKLNLNKNKKVAAKNCLRRKKEFDKILDKRRGILANIEMMLTQFESAEFDSQVINTYRKGIDSLKHVFKGSGIEDIDKVSDTMLDLEEVTDLNDEILQMMSGPIGNNNISDAEIEDELNELIAEEKAEKFKPEDKKEDILESRVVPNDNKIEPTANLNDPDLEFMDNIEKRLLNLRSNSIKELNPSQSDL